MNKIESILSIVFVLGLVLLILHGVYPWFRSDTIFKAIEDNDKEIVIEAVKNSQKLNEIKWVSARKLKAALPNVADSFTARAYMTPLSYAILKKRYEMVELLLENGANPNIQIKSEPGSYGNSLHLSVLADQPKITKLLLNYNVNTNLIEKCGTPLQIAARYGFIEQIKLLIKSGVDVNFQYVTTEKKGYTALHWAVVNNQIEAIEILLQSGANPNVMGSRKDVSDKTPLSRAARLGLLRPAELLISAGADVELASPLFEASFYSKGAGHQHSKIIRLLVESGASINKTGFLGITPFHNIVEYGDIETVEYLIEKGANVNQATDRGTTALHMAVERESMSPSVKAALLKANANPNLQTDVGVTPSLVEALLKANANPNLQTDIGVAPLHLAAFKNDKDVVILLLEYGADKTLRLHENAAINTYRDKNYFPSSSKSAAGFTAEMLTSSRQVKALLK